MSSVVGLERPVLERPVEGQTMQLVRPGKPVLEMTAEERKMLGPVTTLA